MFKDASKFKNSIFQNAKISFSTKFNFFNIYTLYSGTIPGKFSFKALHYNECVSTFQVKYYKLKILCVIGSAC